MSVETKRLAWAVLCLSVVAFLAVSSAPRPETSVAIASPVASRTPITAQVAPTPVARQTADVPAAPRPTRVPDVTYHVPILMYHRIVPADEAGNSLPSMVVAPTLFRAQLKQLRAGGWKTITLAELAAAMRAGRPVAAKTFVITIDDGWNDGYRYAFPILRDLGYHATYFVITDRIGWKSFLSSHQLRMLEAGGNEIGNHTMDHASLQDLTYTRASEDIDGASLALERALGHRPVSFSYPKGGIAPFVEEAVRGCDGLEVAVTTQNGQTESWSDALELPRVTVNSTVPPAALLSELQRG